MDAIVMTKLEPLKEIYRKELFHLETKCPQCRGYYENLKQRALVDVWPGGSHKEDIDVCIYRWDDIRRTYASSLMVSIAGARELARVLLEAAECAERFFDEKNT